MKKVEDTLKEKDTEKTESSDDFFNGCIIGIFLGAFVVAVVILMAG